MTSESTRLVSVWGSPGFGKTSIAIAVGHHLKAQGLPVYFLSLRGLVSKGDLTSKFLGLFRQYATLEDEQLPVQHLSPDDELCKFFCEVADHCVFILDNADDLFECGVPKVKEEVINLIGEILNCNDKVTFLLTTRESIGYLDLRFQGHHDIKIKELDGFSSRNLAHELLPEASTIDCINVAHICGNVPLAMKLMCSSISEDFLQPSQCINAFMESADSIVEMLDNPDYPSDQRLKSLFDASFQRLSTTEKEALVSLCVLPEEFDVKIAEAVLRIRRPEVVKLLQRLQRKSFIHHSSKTEKFSIHKLLLSFAREKGELEMKEVVLNSRSHFHDFHISLFGRLNEYFFTGHSMSSFIDFFEAEQSIVGSLIDGCLDSKTVERVLDVLVGAELFLYILYGSNGAMFYTIYDSAIKAANRLGESNLCKKLLYSKILGSVAFGATGKTRQLLSEAAGFQVPTAEQRGKHLCYNGIYQLAVGKVEDGVKGLEEALSLMDTNPENAVLKVIVSQILTLYYRFKNNSVNSSFFYMKAVQECQLLGDTGLLVIPETEETAEKNEEYNSHSRTSDNTQNQPLQIEVLFLVSRSVAHFSTNVTDQFFRNLLNSILQRSETALPTGTTGSFNYHRTGLFLLNKLCKRALPIALDNLFAFHSATIQENLNNKNHLEALQSCTREVTIKLKLFGEDHAETANSYNSLAATQSSLGDYTSAAESDKHALAIRLKLFGENHAETANSYHSLAAIQHSLGDYTSAAESDKHALDIRLKLFGEDHAETANSYHSLAATQSSLGDNISAAESYKHALAIRLKLFGEEHSETADSYYSLGVTQHSLGDNTLAASSAKRALAIRLKLFGEEHSETADSYYSLGVTQHSLGDNTLAASSAKRALAIRLKLFGEEHSETADSYYSLAAIQHSLGDYTSAAASDKRALAIRLKLFGEEHSETAYSYYSLGFTQQSLGDYTSAAESKMRALAIRLKLFGEEHSDTADSYYSLGFTQNARGDYTSAAESAKRALAIRLKLFGEEHSRTANSYYSLGVTQHSLGDYTSASESKKRALAIILNLFGEEHSETAKTYHSLGLTQHSLGNYASAAESVKRTLAIRLKLLGEEHSETADSYHSLGVTQQSLADYTSAAESHKHALAIRLKLFGENHAKTANSYHSLAATQGSLEDYTSAAESDKHALAIRLKLFGEDHAETANSYHSYAATQSSLGDNISAAESYKHALAIRLKLFGEEHSETADSYYSLGVTQHSLGDNTLAASSAKRALAIRLKLFGEEHSETAKSYYLLGFTQQSLGDYTSAAESKMRALAIRLKLFGEEHSDTADSYY